MDQPPSSEPTRRPNTNLVRLRFLWLRMLLRRRVYATRLGHLKAKFVVDGPGDIMAADYMAGERNLLLATCNEIRLGDVVRDIGANVGHWAVFVGLSVGPCGTVVAFEPFDKAAQRLRGNIAGNRLRNVIIANLALSETPGVATLSVGDVPNYAWSSLLRSGPGTKQILVEQSSVDELIFSQRYPMPNVIKVDVEGAEYKVVRGMHRTLSDSRLRLVVCETNPPLLLEQGVGVQDIVDALEAKGFRCDQIPRIRGPDVHVVARR